jgi:hypothetical protein
MSRTLSVDENNDLYIGPTGSLAISDGLDSVMQAAQQAAQTRLGEMIYATDQGLPYFESVWSGAPSVAQFDAFLRRTLLAVDGVTAVQSLSTTVAGGALSYQAEIQTIYGPGALNG